MRYLTILALALFVIGCESRAERRAHAAADDHATCAGYDLEAGTPAYADCRLRLTQIRAQYDISRRAATAQWFAAQQRQQPAYTPAPIPLPAAPTITRCRSISGTVTCTTY